MRRITDSQGNVFIDRGLGWTALGQPSTPVICPDGYARNPVPFASEPACVPLSPGLPPVCPSWTTWSEKRKLCDLPHGSYGVYGVGQFQFVPTYLLPPPSTPVPSPRVQPRRGDTQPNDVNLRDNNRDRFRVADPCPAGYGYNGKGCCVPLTSPPYPPACSPDRLWNGCGCEARCPAGMYWEQVDRQCVPMSYRPTGVAGMGARNPVASGSFLFSPTTIATPITPPNPPAYAPAPATGTTCSPPCNKDQDCDCSCRCTGKLVTNL